MLLNFFVPTLQFLTHLDFLKYRNKLILTIRTNITWKEADIKNPSRRCYKFLDERYEYNPSIPFHVWLRVSMNLLRRSLVITKCFPYYQFIFLIYYYFWRANDGSITFFPRQFMLKTFQKGVNSRQKRIKIECWMLRVYMDVYHVEEKTKRYIRSFCIYCD